VEAVSTLRALKLVNPGFPELKNRSIITVDVDLAVERSADPVGDDAALRMVALTLNVHAIALAMPARASRGPQRGSRVGVESMASPRVAGR
jgi:hypothetical protein